MKIWWKLFKVTLFTSIYHISLSVSCTFLYPKEWVIIKILHTSKKKKGFPTVFLFLCQPPSATLPLLSLSHSSAFTCTFSVTDFRISRIVRILFASPDKKQGTVKSWTESWLNFLFVICIVWWPHVNGLLVYIIQWAVYCYKDYFDNTRQINFRIYSLPHHPYRYIYPHLITSNH